MKYILSREAVYMWAKYYEGSAEFRRHMVGKIRRVSRNWVVQDVLCPVLGTVLHAFCVFTF